MFCYELFNKELSLRMKLKTFILLVAMVFSCFTNCAEAGSDTFLDYQNYNHGYCPTCNCLPCKCEVPPLDPPPAAAPVPAPCAVPQSPPPAPCDPCAPVCGAECGISLCALGVAAVAVAAAIVIIVTAGSGGGSSSSVHG